MYIIFNIICSDKKFIIRTDHRALIWMLNWRKPSRSTSQYCSWKAELELYDFEIRHRKGEEHINADSMSRYPHCKQRPLLHMDPKEKTNVKMIAHVSETSRTSVRVDPVEAVIKCLKQGERAPRDYRRSPALVKEITCLLRLKHALQVVDGDLLMLKRNNTFLRIPTVMERENWLNEFILS